MICKECTEAGNNNRANTNEYTYFPHPENCGCPCMHLIGRWEKLFSVERPNAQ